MAGGGRSELLLVVRGRHGGPPGLLRWGDRLTLDVHMLAVVMM